MKKILFLALIAQINLSAETSWSSPVAINAGLELSDSQEQSYIYLNNSGTALTFFLKEDSSNSQILVTNSSNFGMTWAPPVQLNMNPSTEHYFNETGSTFISLNQQGRAVFSWLDIDTATEAMGTLKAALFDSSTGWEVTNLENLVFSMSAKGNTTSVIGNDNRAVVSWIKETSSGEFALKSSFYTESGWVEKLITSITTPSTPLLFLSMSPSGEFLFASWFQKTSSTTHSLNVSRYDFDSGSWGMPTTLSSVATSSEFSHVAISDSGTAIAQWAENNSTSPTFFTQIYKDGTWESPTTHSTLLDMDIIFPLPLSINNQGHALLSWAEIKFMDMTVSLKVSSFYGNVWSTGSELISIPLSLGFPYYSSALNNSDLALIVLNDPSQNSLSGGFLQLPSSNWVIEPLDSDVHLSPNSVSLNNQGTGLATWFHGSMHPLFVKTAFFSSGTWTTLDVPGSTSPSMATFLLFPYCALNNGGNALLSWGQQGSTLFYTSTANFGPTPPSEASGYQTFSKFLVPTDLINVLSWQPSTTPNVSYRIYRNGMLIGTSYSPTYDDHQQVPGEAVTYSITAVNESGSQSAPILFTVAPLKK